ncbi:hypothetical protein [Campylobacter sp. MG1]|uniref:hypothetical protein n=1 Tax=Campylobacter sp. MG1 TaxID=2976332 RepID=UPI00226C9C63|nr:hypothetical protein [Campylobacter sp. MG1]
MARLIHFLSFNEYINLDYKKVEENFYVYDNYLYKIDVINNEINFLKAEKLVDLSYKQEHFKFNDFDHKTLKFKRSMLDDNIIDKFKNFYIITKYSDEINLSKLELLEYERLKITLLYGLKSKEYGISIGLALRIYLLFLMNQSKIYEISELINIFSNIFNDDIAKNIIDKNNILDLMSLILDNYGFYVNCNANDSFNKIYIKTLRLYTIKVRRYNEKLDKLLILLDFLSFFKIHKKLDLKEKLLKSKNIKKIARKISKIAKKYY